MSEVYPTVIIQCCNPYWTDAHRKDFIDSATSFSLGLNLSFHSQIVADGVVHFRVTGTSDALKGMASFCERDQSVFSMDILPVLNHAKDKKNGAGRGGQVDNPCAMLHRAGCILSLIKSTFEDDDMNYHAKHDDIYGALETVRDLIAEASANIISDLRRSVNGQVDRARQADAAKHPRDTTEARDTVVDFNAGRVTAVPDKDPPSAA